MMKTTQENPYPENTAQHHSGGDVDSAGLEERRLSPFAFPSETQLRTILLIVAIGAICWRVGLTFTVTFLTEPFGLTPIDEALAPDADIWNIQPSESLIPWPQDILAAENELLERTSEVSRSQAAQQQAHQALEDLKHEFRSIISIVAPYLVLPSLFSLAAFVFVFLMYLAHPYSVERSAKVAHMEDGFRGAVNEMVTEIRQRQEELSRRAVRHVKVILQREFRADGRMYGLPGRYAMALTSGLQRVWRQDVKMHRRSDRLRAVVLHELAHLANGDVGRAFWAESAWLITIAVAVLQATLVIPLFFLPDDLVLSLAQKPSFVISQVLLTLLILEYVRRSLLRLREHYADLRASLFWDVEAPLTRILSGRSGEGWQRFWAKHPSDRARRNVITNSDGLLRVSGDLPFLAAILFSYLLMVVIASSGFLVQLANAYGSLATIRVTQWLMDAADPGFAMMVYYRLGVVPNAALIFVAVITLLVASSFLLTGTVGAQLQHETLVHLVRGESAARSCAKLLWPALLVTSGLEVGLLLVPMTPALPARPALWLGVPLWIVFAAGPIWLWMVTLRLGTRSLLGAHVGGKPPALKKRFLELASLALLWTVIFSITGLQVPLWNIPRPIHLWEGVLIGTFGLILFFVLAILFFFVLGLVSAWQPPRCSNCRHEVAFRPIVGRCCSNCRSELTPWLFVVQEGDV